MSAPGTPAPPTSPATPTPVPAVETVEATDVPTQETSVDQQEPVTVQPLNGYSDGGPEFTTIPASTPLPPDDAASKPQEEEAPKPTWAHGLFGCFDMDVKLLGLSMCCPCITFGANAELLGEDWMLYCLFCILPGATCYFGPYIRQKIRRTFEIEGTDNEDVLSYLLCPCLSIIQETQQLKSAGMKPGGEAMNRSQ